MKGKQILYRRDNVCCPGIAYRSIPAELLEPNLIGSMLVGGDKDELVPVSENEANNLSLLGLPHLTEY